LEIQAKIKITNFKTSFILKASKLKKMSGKNDGPRFNEEEMKSDPEPKQPTISVSEPTEEKTTVLKKTKPGDRAKEWFNRNRVTRVPLIALESDPYKLEDQEWCVFSVITPEEYGSLRHGEEKYHGYLIKFSGVFPTKELATRHIEKLMKFNRHFDVHLVPAFQWSAIDDKAVENREYANEMIGDIMRGYFREENNRMMGIKDRISQTEHTEKSRSQQTTEFFEESQKKELIKDVEVETEPVTLDQLAKQLELKTGGAVLNHDSGPMSKTVTDTVVSSILVDDEPDSDSDDELMKKKK
jgi:hypothetical protein